MLDAATLAARAAELDTNDPWAYLALGFVAFVRRQTNQAVAEFRHALELNPNFAAAHGYLGWTLAFDGQSAERDIQHGPVHRLLFCRSVCKGSRI